MYASITIHMLSQIIFVTCMVNDLDYVGCYVDKLLARTLGTKKTSSRSMTVETCRKTCLKADTKYYGLEVLT